MAVSAKYLSFLFVLILLSSLHVHARESQFFSKVTTNNVKETEVPNKEEEPFSKQEQEPSFIPQTQNGYGLYGHESGQLPPTTTTTPNRKPYTTTTTTNLPYKTESEVPSNNNKYFYNKDAYVTEPQGYRTPTTTNANNYYNGGNNYYNTQQQRGFGETKFVDRGYTTTTNSNSNYNNGGNNNYNSQKLGMSDTRFLENGKYFYDVNSENNYRNEYDNSKGVNYKNRAYYGNNENSYEYNNSMEGYQNQEEFQESQDEFMP